MTRRVIPLKAPTGVAVGGTAVFDITPQDIYHGLLLTYNTTTGGGPTAANMDAELTQFRLNVNGVTQRRFTHAEVRKINAIKGIAFVDGEIPIFFSEPWRRTIDGEDALAWPTDDLGIGGSIQLEIDIDAGATAPISLRGIAEKDYGKAPMGPIVKLRRFNIPVAAIGEHQWSELPYSDSVYALHCFSTDINSIRFETASVVRRDVTKAEADRLLTNNGFVPDANIFTLMFDHTGRHRDALSLVDPRSKQPFKDILVAFDMAAANPFNVVAELIGFRDG